MSSWKGLSTCLAELTSTHQPTFHPSVTRVSEIPTGLTSTRWPTFHPSVTRAGGSPRPFGPWPCAPSDFETGDAHFKADYYYFLRRSWEWGWLFSQTFLLALSPLSTLFSHNGKFSIPAFKIYSRMPSPKPKSLGLPRGVKTRKTYSLF